ncbi:MULTISPECIES: hypothetical protein [unclassified Colwellia]|jgi:hypothetical protein|uniref:hypothetical protein n=1 Tax=unclassified Colwellia TaxID=196834 RepID=UPI0015F75404|nr:MULTISPECIES: hypothetical protein [unclassified Colwellia]MBA6379464.1 hypothetical protein [Colwellia sp. BRX10-7]MBA6385723.1 hypothetical protein [Colwellia sp. BRX10-2]MBA6400755.1 hypothetical protein [Colwellia sp. BRX10-5]MBA6405365.1 hypothetical protein [Colwellia sp. BRX10-1]
MKNYVLIFSLLVTISFIGFSSLSKSEKMTQGLLPEVDMSEIITPTANGSINEEAPIPSQCYTKTAGSNNPCYTCHQTYSHTETDSYRNNLRNDGVNQGLYNFSDEGEGNSWKNLFVNRESWIAKISDEQIAQYIDQDNYSQLSTTLKDNNWQGFIPDLENYNLAGEAFNDKGIAKDGTGWVAFNYKPFPGTFWPTNGATDDVLIRLSAEFRQLNGEYNEDVYLINLSLVEMSIKALPQIDIFPADEVKLNSDLNIDGQFTRQVELLLAQEYFVGDAKQIKVPRQQYPVNTEIMHSVRYVGVDTKGETTIPQRMKELRYMTKTQLLNDSAIDSAYRRERKEKLDEQLPSYIRVKDRGFNNKFGWLIQGYIEDYNGELRPQSYEETFYCMGCHSAIGTTIDQTFAFPRKVTGRAGWGYINLKGMKDAPSKGQQEGEILQYLQINGGGNEFRENMEMHSKWYKKDGSVDKEKVKQADVYALITPSKQRAYAMNKAYTQIVRTQSFIHGRDVNITPAINVHKTIDESVAPLEPEHRVEGWDIRLDWSDKAIN